MITDMSV